MTSDSSERAHDLERFRDYLQVLAESMISAQLRKKTDAADVVQQTLLQAYQAIDQFRGKTDAELAAWLRSILSNVLFGLMREYSRQCRDITREQSMQAIEQSSLQLAHLLAANTSSPSAALHRQEWANEVAHAMLQLTSEQRQAIMLKYWHNATLAQIGEQLGKSNEAVAGLIFRGMQKLREMFQDR